MNIQIIEKSNLRNISKILSSTWINDFIDETKSNSAKKFLKTTLKDCNIHIQSNILRDALNEIYDSLLLHYRNEYVYKNILLNTFIKEHYRLFNTVILNEFQINKSKADVVTINGKNSVFEIKTELDSPSRLKTQVSDYYKAFDQVYIVTHHSLASKYLPILKNDEGLIILNQDNEYSTIKEARPVKDNLCIETMMKCLRKQEFIRVNMNLFHEIPHVKEIYLFNAILEQAKSIAPITYQKEFLSALKLRKLNEADLFYSENTPISLKYICYSLDLSKNQYIRLSKNLNYKL